MFEQIDWGFVLLLVPIFLLALTVHEFAHAITANWGGDLTATHQNRLTLNPVAHIDPIGTILVPLVAAMSGYIFGWARPVPVNDMNFKDKTWTVAVSLAGPYSNLLLAIGGGILLAGFTSVNALGEGAGWWTMNARLFETVQMFGKLFVHVNVFLLFFNLLPVPPLDGSHIFYHFFIRGRGKYYAAWDAYRQFGFMILLVLMMSDILKHFFRASSQFTILILDLTYNGA